ncbi:T9SS type B sorting domain-containing protein [Fibrella aquatilis]|uniref:Gliding motility-associated C-terminal domain-containing protein n=1 Tax=Fibrella aquatilis TaxID=2817059 RepID=A0A939G2Q0_9BACT|nr:T9SS type B sorting domain-containing protein [Fibrella aquatilis]MBO0930088.1 gliding motility-associated C-terminal domain-containing protein [Fibrella aquatilis]
MRYPQRGCSHLRWWGWLLVFGLLPLAGRAQVTLKIVLDPDEVTYRVYMRSAVAYSGIQGLITTAQITLSVPHGVGPKHFEISNVTSPVPKMRWALNDRVDAPAENPDRDYLFFSFINNASPLVLFPIPANTDILLFQFTRTSPCLGGVQLISNDTDEFRTPNSRGINVGNSLSVLGFGGNAYRLTDNAPPTVTIQASVTQLCAGELVRFQAVPSVADPTYQYQWFADGRAITPVVSTPGVSYAFANPADAYTAVVRVKLISPGATPCRSQTVSASTSLLVKPLPMALIRNADARCVPLPTRLEALPVAGATYEWRNDAGPVSPAAVGTDPSYDAPVSGTYTVRVTLNGCAATSPPLPVVGVTQAEKTSVSIGAGQTLLAGQPVALEPVVSNAVSFSWTPTDGLSNGRIRNPVARPTGTTTYTLTAYSKAGCPAQDTVTIRVLPPLFVPSAFTPNGDGQNDVWTPINAQQYTDYQLVILNRWGAVLYETRAATPGWDGQINGTPAPADTYHYQIRTPFHEYAGSVTLIR